MSVPPDEENLQRWLVKHKFEENKARRLEQFEKDKALKDKKTSPWSREAWQAATVRDKAELIEPEPRFPVIISSTGPIITSKTLQEVTGFSSLPDVQWTTRTSVFSFEREEGSIGHDGEKPERVQYCDVSWEQLVRVKECSDGEDVLVCFEGKKRFAWLARSIKQKSGNQTSDR